MGGSPLHGSGKREKREKREKLKVKAREFIKAVCTVVSNMSLQGVQNVWKAGKVDTGRASRSVPVLSDFPDIPDSENVLCCAGVQNVKNGDGQ